MTSLCSFYWQYHQNFNAIKKIILPNYWNRSELIIGIEVNNQLIIKQTELIK